jgi:N-acetylmuramoyl-L-alanine amidase
MTYEFKVNHIPIDGDNRPGIKAEKNSFTVHNTANTATDEQERDNIARTDNDAEVGFNYVCDEDSVTECIPPDEVTWNCGNKYGNYHTISLEIAERPGAEEVAIEFISDKFVELNWNIDVLTTHQYWSGKYCPRQILPHWDKFVAKVLKKIQEKRGEDEMLDKIVTYLDDPDLFSGAVTLSQKHHCPLMLKSDFDKSGLKVKEEIIIGGKQGSDRFSTFRDSAQII